MTFYESLCGLVEDPAAIDREMYYTGISGDNMGLIKEGAVPDPNYIVYLCNKLGVLVPECVQKVENMPDYIKEALISQSSTQRRHSARVRRVTIKRPFINLDDDNDDTMEAVSSVDKLKNLAYCRVCSELERMGLLDVRTHNSSKEIDPLTRAGNIIIDILKASEDFMTCLYSILGADEISLEHKYPCAFVKAVNTRDKVDGDSVDLLTLNFSYDAG